MTTSTSDRHGRPPLFWIGTDPPGDGDLGPDHLLITLNLWPALYQMHDIDRLCEHLLKEIRAIQPEGPYFLGGFCAKGLFAYDIAQKLVASGHEVELLVLVEPLGPDLPRIPLRILRRMLLTVLHPITVLRFVSKRLGFVTREELGRLVRRFGDSLTRQQAQSKAAKELDVTYNSRAEEMLKNYVPKPYHGRLTFIVGDRSPVQFFLRSRWSKLAHGGLDIYAESYATRMDVLHTKVVAAKIGWCIDRITHSQSCRDGFAGTECEPDRVTK